MPTRLRPFLPSLSVAAVVLAGTAFSAYYTLQVTGWGVMTDELQVVKLGVSVAQTLNPLPRIRGESIGAYSQLYPIATAPAYGLFSMSAAFRLVHFLNSLLMASTAIPAYLLTRQVVRWRPAAWAVAALTVLVPWMAMATMVLTEVGAYPVFVWVVLAIYMALIRPSWRRDLVALLAIGVGFLARTQFVVLAAAFPIALLAHELGYAALGASGGSLRRRLLDSLRRLVREHLPLAAVTCAGVLGLLIPPIHERLLNALGNYSGTATGSLLPAGSANIAEQLAAVVGIAVGVIPFVLGLGWVLGTAIRPEDKRAHAFAVLTAVAGILLTLEVTSFLIRFSGAVQDRYIFYLVPLLFVATAACLLEARVRWPGVAIATALLAWVTTKTDFTTQAIRPYFGSPPSAFNPAIEARTIQLGHFFGIDHLHVRPTILVITLVLGAASVLALRRAPRRTLFAVATTAVALFLVVETRAVSSRMTGNISAGTVTGRDWVDSHTPDGAFAAMLPGTVNERNDGIPIFLDDYTQIANWWGVEFFNKSVKRSVSFRSNSYGQAAVPNIAPFSEIATQADPETGLLRPGLPTPYVVVSASDDWLRLRGETVELHSDNLELMKVPAPARADWITDDLPRDGWTDPGRRFRIRVFNDPANAGRRRTVSITLDSVPEIKAARPFTIVSGHTRTRGKIPANSFRRVSVNICGGPGPHTDLTVGVTGATPISFLEGRSAGLHVSKIDVRAPRRSCRPGS